MIAALAIIFFALLLLHSTAHSSTTSPNQLLSQGFALIKKGQYEDAIKKLEAARIFLPKDVRLLYQLGISYYNIGSEKDDITLMKQAQRYWKSAIEHTPESTMLGKTLGDIIQRADMRINKTERKLALQAILKAKPALLEEGLELAEIYKKEGKHNQAAQLFESLIRSNKFDPRPYNALAATVYKGKRILWAEHYYTQALKVAPDNKEAQNALDFIHNELEAYRLEGYDELVRLNH